jgi:hypothetical protein
MEKNNTLVHLDIKKMGKLYECVGVLMGNIDGKLKIAFNAANDKVIDSYLIENECILEQKIITKDLIEEIN